MGAEELKLATVILELFRLMGGWPLPVIILIILIGPWILAILLFRGQEKRFDQATRSADERFEGVTKMYESNVILVETTQALAQEAIQTSKDNREMVVLNTEAMTRMTDAINTNQFCPAARVVKRTEQHKVG